MLKKLADCLVSISAYFFPSEERELQRQPEDYFLLVEEARQEWRRARDRFDQISDPDLVDHAIYNLGAAERRYVYLLKKAKEEGVNLYPVADKGGN